MGKKVKITLTVEASALYALQAPVSQADVDAKSGLEDDNSGSSPGNGTIENFTSTVYLNNDVQWVGEVKYKNGVDQGYNVAITSIVYESDDNFFNNTTLNGTGGRSGNVTSKVKDEDSLQGKTDTYTINFSVYPKGSGDPKPFSIDPKLRIPPSS